MKVLQVNCVHNIGSTGKIMYDIHCELEKNGVESIICYGRGELVKEKNIYKTCGEFYSHVNHFFANLTGVLYGGCYFSTQKLISIIKKEKPDIVHLHCINGYFVNIYRLVGWLKKQKIQTILTLHAEFMHTGGCGHALECNQWKDGVGCGQAKCPYYRTDKGVWFFDRSRTMFRRMYKAFEGFDYNKLTIVSVSPWLMGRAQQSIILGVFKNTYVLNGLNTNIFYLKKKEKIEGIPNKRIILHITPFFDDNPESLKGGYYFIELAKRFEEDERFHFVVVGNYKNIENLPKNMTLLGRVSSQEQLASIYSLAEITVLTSRRETFSMVTAESLCCGTPVVGFYAGGPESIAIEKYTRFVEYGNIEALANRLKEMLNVAFSREEISNAATEKYSRKNMLQGYLSIYQNDRG